MIIFWLLHDVETFLYLSILFLYSRVAFLSHLFLINHFDTMILMTVVHNKTHPPVQNQNLKQMVPKNAVKTLSPIADKTTPEISDQAKELNANSPTTETPITQTDAAVKATSVAKDLAKLPVLPVVIPKETKKLQDKIDDKQVPKAHHKAAPIKKPAVLFIEGFSAFGISNGDGIKDMADNFQGAKKFSWDEKDSIIEEIKKHAPDQPVILVGHSFGGDSAIEIANELNNVKHGFRTIDLLVSVDSVGLNHSIIPMNVKRNLNFFGEGLVPFLHGDPTVARNTDYTQVVNELRSELHSKMEDTPEVQYKIFESINETLNEKEQSKELEQLILQALAQNNGDL